MDLFTRALSQSFLCTWIAWGSCWNYTVIQWVCSPRYCIPNRLPSDACAAGVGSSEIVHHPCSQYFNSISQDKNYVISRKSIQKPTDLQKILFDCAHFSHSFLPEVDPSHSFIALRSEGLKSLNNKVRDHCPHYKRVVLTFAQVNPWTGWQELGWSAGGLWQLRKLELP